VLMWKLLRTERDSEVVSVSHLGNGGTFLVSTGKHTGRSPKDKFVVRTASVEDTIWWENNQPMDPAAFDVLYADMLEHMKGRDYFVQDLIGGADADNHIDVRVLHRRYYPLGHGRLVLLHARMNRGDDDIEIDE